MRTTVAAALAWVFALGAAGVTAGDVIGFAGGWALLDNGFDVTTNDIEIWVDRVDCYVEDGFQVDFVGGYGTVGDYYSTGAGGLVRNSVVHAHWESVSSIVVTRLDSAPFDLNYMDLTSNTQVGGGQCTGDELSYVTASNGHSMLLPPSDWGFAWDHNGHVGDGVQGLWLDDFFDDITSFTITSENAYCFGLDNLYLDEPPPPHPDLPEPSTLVMLLPVALGAAAAWSRRARKPG